MRTWRGFFYRVSDHKKLVPYSKTKSKCKHGQTLEVVVPD